MIDILIFPLFIDIGRYLYSDIIASPTSWPIVKYGLFFTDQESLALEPSIFKQIKAFFILREELEGSAHRESMHSATYVWIGA